MGDLKTRPKNFSRPVSASMGCASSVPLESRPADNTTNRRESRATSMCGSAQLEGGPSEKMNPDQDTTASGKISTWQMPLIWDMKNSRPPSLNRIPSSEVPFESLRTPNSDKMGAPVLNRSTTDRGVVKVEQRTTRVSRRQLGLRRDKSLAEISTTQFNTPSLTRSRSYTSTSPAGSVTSTAVFPSPASSNASSGVDQSFYTRKGIFRRSIDETAPINRSTLRTSISFSDVSRRRFQ